MSWALDIMWHLNKHGQSRAARRVRCWSVGMLIETPAPRAGGRQFGNELTQGYQTMEILVYKISTISGLDLRSFFCTHDKKRR